MAGEPGGGAALQPYVCENLKTEAPKVARFYCVANRRVDLGVDLLRKYLRKIIFLGNDAAYVSRSCV